MPTPSEPPLTAFPAPGPRRWVPVPVVPCEHVDHSKGMILQASGSVSGGDAIVLGAGRCQEIPLAALAGRFASLTLNDHDETQLDAAIAAAGLVGDKGRAVSTLVADLTGVTAAFLAAIDGCLEAPGVTAGAAAEQMAGAAADIRPVPFTTGRRYDLVVASCVLCQLHLAACNLAIARFDTRFPGQGAVLRQSAPWVQAVYGLARRMEDVFIDALHGLIAPRGRLFFSDTVQCAFLHNAPTGGWVTEGLYRMTRTTQLSDYLDDRFRVEHAGRWLWVMDPSKELNGVGRLYKVQAFILSPR